MRSGTLAPHLVVGLGEASKLALAEMESDSIYMKKLNKKTPRFVFIAIPTIQIVFKKFNQKY